MPIFIFAENCTDGTNEWLAQNADELGIEYYIETGNEEQRGIGGGIVMPGGMGDIGNIPTEDIVNMLNRSGLDTGLDTKLMALTAKKIEEILGIPSRSFVARNDDIGV